MPRPAAILPLLLALPAQGQEVAPRDLTLPDAIRAAWSGQSGLQAGQALVERARFDADAAAALRRPTFQAQAGWTRTTEPMQAFGLKLDQARIQATDFDPARLNRPDAVSGLGGAFSVQQPLYAGGRLDAARRGLSAMADAESSRQRHRRQQVAAAVVQAYFGAQAAEGGIAAAEETRKSAAATEAFVAARVEQGLMLRSELARMKAFRAQADAALAEARRQARSARAALALLTGEPGNFRLLTPLDAPDAAPPGTTEPGRRADLEAARFEARAAGENAKAAAGVLRPEVGLNLAWGAARERLTGAGGSWTTASVGAKWTFSFSEPKRIQAAHAAERAAELNARWQSEQARHDVDEAASSITAAQQRLAAAQEAVGASEEARNLRQARHREGLLPLTDLLDAEAALQGARALRLAALLELRTARAQSDLAQGRPIEGVTE
ncbi:MAG: TolC family protein [Holophagaceae bacterium]|nr:TolC family protein [Holophagaceae bacterium]